MGIKPKLVGLTDDTLNKGTEDWDVSKRVSFKLYSVIVWPFDRIKKSIDSQMMKFTSE